MEAKVAATALFLLLLTFGEEGKIWKERSRTFKSWCARNDNCVAICVGEDNTGGYSHGIVRRECMYTKKCGDGGSEPPEPPEEPRENPPKEPPEDPPTRA